MTTNKDAMVLIVDDEPELCNIIEFYVSSAGYKTKICHGGFEALEYIKLNKVDLIISDIRMPLGTGIELLDGVNSNNQHVPVVLLMTGHTDVPLDVAYDKGAEALFTKPVDPDVLVREIERALQSRAERWQTRAEGRLPTTGQVKYQIKSIAEARVAKLVNISRGGIFVGIDSKNLPQGLDVLEFELTMENGQYSPIAGSGIVRWIRRTPVDNLPIGFGMEFISLSQESIQNVEDFLKSNSTKSFIPRS